MFPIMKILYLFELKIKGRDTLEMNSHVDQLDLLDRFLLSDPELLVDLVHLEDPLVQQDQADPKHSDGTRHRVPIAVATRDFSS